jgi:hypothetical protein
MIKHFTIQVKKQKTQQHRGRTTETVREEERRYVKGENEK